MKRFDVSPHDVCEYVPGVSDPKYCAGEYVRYNDVAPLIAAVDKLLAAKGRFHTEQNYNALVAARAELEKK